MKTKIDELSELASALKKEAQFQLGKKDRKAGKPCASANGAYLNGWYSPEKDFYYITVDSAHLL